MPCLSLFIILVEQMIRRIINSRSKTITFSAGLIAFSVGVSAILGLLRDRLLVGYFNIEKLDIYFAAFAIPDFVYGVIITGGIVAAFLPIFALTLEKSKSEGWKLANNTLNVLIITLTILCGILFLFTPFIVKIIAPGFSPEYLQETVFLTRIMLISPILLGASSLFSGVLQYFDKFLAYSLAPIFYNIGIIFGIIFFTPYFGLVGLAYGVILGSILHFLVQIPSSYFSGFSYQAVVDLNQKELRRIFYLMIPRIVGQVTSKVNVVVITALASLLTAGSISIFNLANHLQSFPVRVIGVAFAIAAFPAFSRSVAAKEKEKFTKSLSSVICQVLFFIVPISIIIFLLRAHIVRLVLGTEGFGWKETQLTAASLGVFAFSFFAAALVHVLVRAFFSFQDTKTPVIASLISMGTNIVLSFFFVWVLGFDNIFRNLLAFLLKIETINSIEVIAFPLAILFSTVLHFILLIYLFKSRVGGFRGMGIKDCLEKIILSSTIMGALTFFLLRVIGKTIVLQTFFAVLIQTIIAVVFAVFIYVLVSKLLNSKELFSIKEAFLRR
jgi:putative peptidoglycan lipid II flippase